MVSIAVGIAGKPLSPTTVEREGALFVVPLCSNDLMTSVARLAAVSLDASDPAPVAAFYRDLLELEIVWDSADFVALKGAGVLITVQRVEGFRPVEWPTGEVPKQMHLELAVDDLEGAEAQAIARGATKASTQPAPEKWRVLIDPAGHPFCITTLIPRPLR